MGLQQYRDSFHGMTEFPASSEVRARRAAAPIRVYRLGGEPPDSAAIGLSVERRIALVWELTQRLWELGGRPVQSLPRAEWPVQVVRRQ